MLPIRWDPAREMGSLQREFDDLFHRIFGVTREGGGDLARVTVPAVNSYVKDGVLHIEAELPGVEAGQLDVRVDGRDVVISGERRAAHSEEKADFLMRESRITRFERRLGLPEGAEGEKAHAVYRDGLLEVTMPMTVVKAGGRKLVVEGLDTGKKSKEIH